MDIAANIENPRALPQTRRQEATAKAWPKWRSACWPLLLAAGACVVSLNRTGYTFDISNHTFDLPIVLRFADLPQFANDPFILSLRQFTSALYPLLSLVATEHNVSGLFFCGLALTHMLTFLALLRIGQVCGIKAWHEQALFIFLLAATKSLYGLSPVGADTLLIRYFTHSELARAVGLFAVASLLRQRLILAGFLGGVTFALNALMGIWLLAPLAAFALLHFAEARADSDWRGRGRRVLTAGVAYAIPAAPVAVWIASVTVGSSVDFDYRAFLRDYYPFHFFLDASSGWQIAQLACAIAAGALATRLTPAGGPARLVLASLTAVFGFGAVVGAVSSSRLLLNLHLLRVDGLVVLICAALVTAAVVAQLRPARLLGSATAGVAALGMFAGLWPVAATCLLWANWPGVNRLPAWLRGPLPWAPLAQRAVLAAAIVLAAGGSVYAAHRRHAVPAGAPTDESLMGTNAPVHDWLDVQHWARTHTPPDAMFLVPLELEGLRTGAERRIWLTDKDGATAMWAPETYDTWHQRREQVRKLDSFAATMAYACAHAIDYVVLDLRPRQGKPVDPAHAVFIDTWFEVHQAHCTP